MRNDAHNFLTITVISVEHDNRSSLDILEELQSNIDFFNQSIGDVDGLQNRHSA